MSDVFDLADAVATQVNLGSYSQSFTASGVALVEYTMDDLLEDVIVECVPRQKSIAALTRAKDRTEVTIGVAVMKQVGVTTGKVNRLDVNDLVDLCESIADQLRSVNLTVNGRNAVWMNNEIDPIYDIEAMYHAQQFRSVVNATYLMTTP